MAAIQLTGYCNVAPQEASHPPKRAIRVCTRCEIDSAGDLTAGELVDKSSRDLIVYEGSHPARSCKCANLDSAAIINNSNVVLERYFEL